VAATAGPSARIVLDVAPADASVYVDGRFRGLVGDLRSLTLTPGRHRVEIVRPGHAVFEEEIEVREGEDRPIRVTLAPVI
jgi:hypothetical protein